MLAISTSDAICYLLLVLKTLMNAKPVDTSAAAFPAKEEYRFPGVAVSDNRV